MELMVADAYVRQLQALLPRGAAWPREDGAVLTQLLRALAAEFGRADSRAADLARESDPRLTYELLADWERAYGLPAPCMSGIAQTLAQRRNALAYQIGAIGAQTPQYFVDVAAMLGYSVTVTEFREFNVGMSVADPIYGEDWNFAWRINAPSVTVRDFTAMSGVNEPLRSWGDELLTCVISRLKPAHTILIFVFG